MTAPGQIPVPRSFQQIYGQQIDAFLSRTGARTLDVNDPINFLIIASAQSDLRNTSDIFALLAASTLKNARGLALDRIGADQKYPRRSATYASGDVDFTDTAFQKVFTSVYAGAAAPNAGTTTLLVADASAFTATGSIYLDRGTVSIEGPLAYTAKTSFGSYWSLTLAAPTQNFHNVNAPVVLAQGGDRPISAGTVIQTQPGSLSAAVNFSTTFPAIIADGETTVTGVSVTAQQPGSTGNAPATTINTVVTSSLSTLVVNNALPFTNGFNVQNDDDYRAALQQLLQTRSRATPLAIVFNSLGVSSALENKTVVSAAITAVPTEPVTLYIDDGSGYQELDQGIASEVIVPRAQGGEYSFALAARPPVTKAFAQTTLATPFALVPGAQLGFRIQGLVTSHSFSADEFSSIGSATADEVASAVNSDPALTWSARVVKGGQAVAFFAQAETNEDLEVVAPVTGIDANDFLGIPAGINYTLRLYKNDTLLYKDGITASVSTNVQSAWSPTMATGVQIEVSVDGTPGSVYTFTDSDFVTAGTAYTTLAANNSLASWAQVWNAKVPGLTATATGGTLVFTSNLGPNARSAITFSAPAADLPTLAYKTKTGDFTVGDTLTGGSSGATATILDDDSAGATGILTVTPISGTFAVNELITDAHTGSAHVATALATTPPNLITLGMFSPEVLSSTGRPRDYALNRNTGKLKIFTALQAGETLTAGTTALRAYLQSSAHPLSTVTIPAPATAWVVLDGAAQALTTGLSGASVITTDSTLTNGRARYTVAGTSVFGDANGMFIAAGDWFISYDPSMAVVGAWRVSDVLQTTPWNWFEVERPVGGDQISVTATQNGFAFVRTQAQLQALRLPAATDQTLISVASALGAQLRGGTVSVYRNQFLRITTNSYDNDGDVFVAAVDTGGHALGFKTGTLVSNSDNHVATVVSGNTDEGTPSMSVFSVSALTAVNGFTASATGLSSGRLLHWVHRVPTTGGHGAWGRTAGSLEPATVNGTTVAAEDQVTTYALATGGIVRSGTTVTATTSVTHGFRVGDFVYLWPLGSPDANFAAGYKLVTAVTTNTFTYTEAGSAVASTLAYVVGLDQGHLINDQIFSVSPYAIGPVDTLNVVLDGDDVNKNFGLPMWRQISPGGGAVYASSGFAVTDADNGNAPLSTAFGSTVPDLFRDFVLYEHGRGKSHAAGGSSANKALLWRWARMGPEGNAVTVAYVAPSAPSTAMKYAVVNGSLSGSATVAFGLTLPSGPARASLALTATTQWTVAVTGGSPADILTFTYSQPTIASGGLIRSGSTVTGTTGSAHGFSAGQIVYLTSSTDPNFPTGPKALATASGTTFTYVEGGAAGPSVSTALISSAPTNPTLTASVVVGDIVNINSLTAFPAGDQGVLRVHAVTGTTFQVRIPTGTGTVVTTPVSQKSLTGITFYPLTVTTAATVATWVNANASTLISAVVVDNGGGSPGTGIIERSTEEEYLAGTTNSSLGSVSSWILQDGINWVQTSDLGSLPNTIKLKNAVAADLTANADFGNEVFRLVPMTVDNSVSWLTSPGVSGFYAGSEVLASNRDQRLQLASTTQGSAGSIQVIGGTADSAGASLLGSGALTSGGWAYVTLATPQSLGLTGTSWVALQNGSVGIKATPWTTASSLTIGSAGAISITGTGAVWTLRQSLGTSGDIWLVRKSGNFCAYTLVPIGGNSISSSVIEGDWVEITFTTGSVGNQGTFRVVASSHAQNTFWVENPDAVTETVTGAGNGLSFFSYDSVMPGDALTIDTTAFGAGIAGVYTVTSRGGANTDFVVTPAPAVLSTTVMSTAAPFIRVTEAKALRAIKQIAALGPNAAGLGFTDVLFTTPNLVSKTGASQGAVLQALDKFLFPTEVATGADAYSVATGLIGAVNQILYGDPSNPDVFPGVVAAGANVNVEGALIKAIEISLAIRITAGVVTQPQAISNVKNAVAGLINSLKTGQSLAIGNVVAAAQAVAGVSAVSVISPAYSSADDEILVLPREKARVLSLSSIQVQVIN